MMDPSQSSYGAPPPPPPPSGYEQDGSAGYSDYTPLSSASHKPRYQGDSKDALSPDKNDPYAIDSQTFDDFDDQSGGVKSKKGRAKKTDDKVKKERKPRGPRGQKAAAGGLQPQSPASAMQARSAQPSTVPTPDMSPASNSMLNHQAPMAAAGPSGTPPVPVMSQPMQPSHVAPVPPAPGSMPMPESSVITQQHAAPYPGSAAQPIMLPKNPASEISSGPPDSQNAPMSGGGGGGGGPSGAIKSPAPRMAVEQPSVAPPPPPSVQYPYGADGPPPTHPPPPANYYSSQPTVPPTSQSPYYQPPPYDSTRTQATPWSEPQSGVQQQQQQQRMGGAMSAEPPATSDYATQPQMQPVDSNSSYTTLSAPDKANEMGPVPPATSSETQQLEPHTLAASSISPADPSVSTDQADQSAAKTKKTRAKKGGDPDKPKKERKSRAKGAKPDASAAQSPNTLLETSNTQVMPESANLGDTRSPVHRLSTDSAPHYTYSQKPNLYDGNSNQTYLGEGSTQHAPDGSYSGGAYFAPQSSTDQDISGPAGGADGETKSSKKKASKSAPKGDKSAAKKERKPRVKKQQQQPDTATSEDPALVDQDASMTLTQTSDAPADSSLAPAEPTTPVEAKPKRIRIRDSGSKGKKKLPKFALKFAKTKKRKRLGSSDNDQSDLDKTPPPSPDEVESGVQKRRSARNTKKLKYNDDIALGFSDSDDDSPSQSKKKSNNVNGEPGADDSVIVDEPTVYAAPVEDTMVVEKIMSSRMGKRELEPEPGEVLPPDGQWIEVEEFYVKYKNLSYLHCDWRTLEELERGDRRVAQKVKRYKQKKDNSNMFSFMDEEAFDPQYCEVDRILAVNEVEEMVPVSDAEDDDPEKAKTAAQAEPEPKADQVASVTEDAPMAVEADAKTSEESAPEKSVEEPTDKIESKDDEATNLKSPAEEQSEPKTAEAVESEEPAADKPLEAEQVVKVEEPSEALEQKENDKPQEENSTEDKQPDAAPMDVVEEKPRPMKKKISRHYLVKWKGLSYEESTWELEDDLDPEKIKHFMRFKDPPPKSKWKAVKRPKPEEWVRKEASPVYKNNNTLREYQLEGINWLSFCWHQGRNCILADEMGLGKTIQSIAFVNEIYQYGINGPFLIIVPLSTVGNWAREFETWTDLNVITYHGGNTSREMLKEYEMFYRNEQGNRITSYYKFQVMITTFEIILSDCLDLREIPWRCCIIDEAHRLKNRNCKLLEGLRLLNMEHRVLLTGTPLQNNVEELFSLLNFLEPTQFSSTEQFLQEFGDLKTEAQVDKLKLILKPMMLRRLKEDVEKTLAPKEETIVEVELTNIQKKYYRAILERNFSFLTKGSSNNNMPNLMNTMMELRKCCIHPYLINGAEEQIMYEAKQAKLAGGEPLSAHQAMVNSSGKLVLIDKLLPRLKADGHRVLIFSQMVRCLDILEDYVTHKHYPYERIDGRVRGSERQQAIDRYSKPGSDRFVFLLCTRAGGLGINLTAADTVIIFDSDWNPQNDLQAQARCHRIGQSKAVKIYRLICRNTYEREMFDKASLKLGLDKAVLQSMNTQKGGAGGLDGQLTKKEIEELLKKGAYGALMDDDNAGDKFCEEDIDQILQRRTTVITIESAEAKGSTFSKATFSSSNNREDIELDDPNFWEKWAKKANIETDDLDKDDLIQLAPRRRTQTRRYGADGSVLDISDLDSSEEDEETISMRTRGSRRGQSKIISSSASKRNKRYRFLEDDEFLASHDGGIWSKSDCIKVEKGLLTYGWGRWDKIIANNRFKKEISEEDCESICRVILLYCLNNYKGDEKIKSFAWELITPQEEANKSASERESHSPVRGRKPKSVPIALSKKTIAEEIADSKWPKEAKNDPLIALPDDQYRKHLQRNANR